jgi:two-component system cell cycle sensor histidine kinase/response regulator CckA
MLVAAAVVFALACAVFAFGRRAARGPVSPNGVETPDAIRRRLELELAESRRLETLGLLAGGIAHDFNNLLTVILGNARLALAELDPADPLRQRLARIEAAAEHGAALTEQMVIYSGRGSFVKKPADLSRVVEGVLELVRAAVPPRIELSASLDAPAWSEVDETQIRQVVLAIVRLAGETLGDEPGAIALRCGTRRLGAAELGEAHGGADVAPGEFAFIEVRHGAPRPASSADRSAAAPNAATRGAGRGLGLAGVLEIASAHGGVLQVENDPSGARCVRVLVPGAGRPLAGSTRAEGTPEVERAVGSARVLLIDEEPGVLEIAAELLERAGFAVTVAATGTEGLARFREAPGSFAAAVVDLSMRDLAGEAVAAELRAVRPDLPVVLASGLSAELAAYRTVELGAARFLRKPYAPDALARTVIEMLADRNASPLATRLPTAD